MAQDFPFYEVVKRSDELLAKYKCAIFQKFTCEKCGNRLTIDEPNTFYKKGRCDKCNHITNIEENGCNYLLIMGHIPT